MLAMLTPRRAHNGTTTHRYRGSCTQAEGHHLPACRHSGAWVVRSRAALGLKGVHCGRATRWQADMANAEGASSIAEARERVRTEIAAIKVGRPIGHTFGAIADQWFTRHVEAKGLRSGAETRRLMAKHLRSINDLEFESVRRGDVAALLDHVEDTSGKRTAECCQSSAAFALGTRSGTRTTSPQSSRV